MPNEKDQRPRDSDNRLPTATLSRGSLDPACWAIVSCSPTPKMHSKSDEETRDGCKRKEQEHAPQSLLSRI